MALRSILTVLAIGLLCASSTPAVSGVIDLRDLPGNINQAHWGQPDSTLYAQSIVADDLFLDEFTFRATHASGGDILANVMVTGARSDSGGLGLAPNFADIRFNSGQLTVPIGSGQNEITVQPDIGVTNGETLFFVLDTFSYPASGRGTLRATQAGVTDQYLPGEFVFINTGSLSGVTTLQDIDAYSWSHRAINKQDLAVSVTFVPDPATIWLLGLGGLALRKKRKA